MKFILNKLNSNLQLIAGSISIPPGKFAEITDNQAEHFDVDYAISRKWATLHDATPTAAMLNKNTPEISIAKVDVGMTSEELKEFQANKQSSTGAKAEKLGKEESSEPITKGSATKLGDVPAEISAEDLRDKTSAAKEALEPVEPVDEVPAVAETEVVVETEKPVTTRKPRK